MKLLNTKSVLKGEITPEQIENLIAEYQSLDLGIVRAHLEDITNFEEDTVVCEGDLEIDGNFELFDNKICNLIVTGNLTVNGTLENFDDPATMILVGKNLKAKNLITAGTLFVCGDLEIENALVGDYNDYSAEILGNASAGFFYPEEHHFEIGGEIRFDRAFGNTWRLNSDDNPVEFMTSKQGYHAFHEDLLVEPVEPELLPELADDDEFFEYLESRVLFKRIRDNQPIFKN
ncbi:hypothetical protein D3C87_84840 [compost metagenome]